MNLYVFVELTGFHIETTRCQLEEHSPNNE